MSKWENFKHWWSWHWPAVFALILATIVIVLIVILGILDTRRVKDLESRLNYRISMGYRYYYECESYDLTRDILIMKLTNRETVKIEFPTNVKIEKLK